jgi:hypothetical protein
MKFTEHPGYKNHESESMVQQKAKLICSKKLERHVAVELVCDERETQQGFRDRIRDEDEVPQSNCWSSVGELLTRCCSLGYRSA